ncbi:two-component sensor histidine kinase [Mycobacterium sp. E1386]|nr:two-component sensor histidine kinase [Mycobacterium sp. E1386]OBI35584.1 two-component sensor histidine kinase [Mycobacterium sp. E2238]
MRPCRIGSVQLRRLPHWGIAARSAAVSAMVVLCALLLAGAALDAFLYRSLLVGVDYAAAERVRDLAKALQTEPPAGLDNALFSTDQRVVAVQVVAADGTVVKRSRSAPRTSLVPVTTFGAALRRGLSDDAVAGDDMRVSGQRVATAAGDYAVIVGGGSQAVEETARTVALLLAAGAPVVIAGAAVATFLLVRRSLRSVDAIRAHVAEISTSDLAERVPVPNGRDEIAALAVTMNRMLSRIEAGHRAQQRFIGDASHELRSPLATIISGLEVAEAHPDLLDAELAVNTLLPEAQRMHALIEDLLLLARADEQSLVRRTEVLALDEIADVEVARARREASCAIDTDIGPVRCIGDPMAISRMIRNLVENAVRHATSRVAVEVGSVDGTAIVTVSDDGPGIGPGDRARVFERFVRLDTDRARSGGGAGLGLAIVAEVVGAHGGSVTIEDRPGGGTRMVVSLPLGDPQHSSR